VRPRATDDHANKKKYTVVQQNLVYKSVNHDATGKFLEPILFQLFLVIMANGSITHVVVTLKRNAKKVKDALATNQVLDKSFRMSGIDLDSFSQFVPLGRQPLHQEILMSSSSEYICIPIREELLRYFSTWNAEDTVSSNTSTDSHFEEILMDLVVGHARQSCPFSSTVMGDVNRRIKLSSTTNSDFNLIQNVLVGAIKEFFPDQYENSAETINEKVGNLSSITAPPKLEIMGNDRTVVIPHSSLNTVTDSTFHDLIESILGKASRREDFMNILWGKIASSFRSQRVVRRGEISPDSKVRESGHSILWIDPSIDTKMSTGSGEYCISLTDTVCDSLLYMELLRTSTYFLYNFYGILFLQVQNQEAG
jgi:hypothetical protein